MTYFVHPEEVDDEEPLREADPRGAPRGPRAWREETLADTSVWVLPNPSGLNAHYRLEDLAEKLRELFVAVQEG